jgi:hypothetical protein
MNATYWMNVSGVGAKSLNNVICSDLDDRTIALHLENLTPADADDASPDHNEPFSF